MASPYFRSWEATVFGRKGHKTVWDCERVTWDEYNEAAKLYEVQSDAPQSSVIPS